MIKADVMKLIADGKSIYYSSSYDREIIKIDPVVDKTSTFYNASCDIPITDPYDDSEIKQMYCDYSACFESLNKLVSHYERVIEDDFHRKNSILDINVKLFKKGT